MTDDMVYSGSRSLHRTKMCVIAVMKIGDIKYGKIFSDRGVTGQSQNDQKVLGGEL